MSDKKEAIARIMDRLAPAYGHDLASRDSGHNLSYDKLVRLETALNAMSTRALCEMDYLMGQYYVRSSREHEMTPAEKERHRKPWREMKREYEAKQAAAAQQAEAAVKVRVTAHRGLIVIEAVEPEKALDGWVPIGPGRLGSVICKTKNHLGVSDEALVLLKQVPRSLDCIGDLDWWLCEDGSHAFAWLGATKRIFAPARMSGSRSYVVPEGHHVRIPNDVPADAQQAINDSLAMED